MKMLDNLCIYAMIRAGKVKDRLEEFVTSQEGVSNVVATIVILMIVVIILGIFWKSLQAWLQPMIDRIFGEKFGTTLEPV